jgi:hypothetical protein
VARYYQYDNRQVFLKQLLKRFQDEDMVFYNYLRKITKSITNFLDEIERNIDKEPSGWNFNVKLNELMEVIEKEKRNQLALLKFYSGRLQLEFRKNLQLMSNDLSKLYINSIIRRKIRSRKYYKKLMLEITNFPYDHVLRIKTLINMILMELSLNSAENRIESFHEEFIEQMTTVINQKYHRLIMTLEGLQKTKGKFYDLNKIKFDEEFEAELKEEFSEGIERMVAIMESMPETLEIYSLKNMQKADEETLSIPVASMADYYFKSRYELTVEEKFNDLLEMIKKSVYKIRDLLVLTQFNLENNPSSELHNINTEILKECTSKIEKEYSKIHEQVVQYIEFANHQFDKTFEPLSLSKIEESANDYISGLRNYQGQIVLGGVHRISALIGDMFKSAITRLFYSRSKGILLAKKLN